MREIAVTGSGLITCLGGDVAESWASVVAGRSGIRTIRRFPLDALPTTFAGWVPHEGPAFDSHAHARRLLLRAANEAIEAAGIRMQDGQVFLAGPLLKIGLDHCLDMVIRGGTEPTLPALTRWLRNLSPVQSCADSFTVPLANDLGRAFASPHVPMVFHTACATGADAIAIALRAIRLGRIRTALVAGVATPVSQASLADFCLLSALSRFNEDPARASRPFSLGRDGFVMAEGAAALVLEDLDHARERGANVLARVVGAGRSSDSFHRTRGSADGRPIALAIKRALDDARIGPEQIDYVNAHGTGTPENDKLECRALKEIFTQTPPVSSNKSILGHNLEAAGLVEAVLSIETLRAGVLPPTINYQMPDPEIDLDVVPNVARDAKVSYVLSNSFGFGGQNACVVFAKA